MPTYRYKAVSQPGDVLEGFMEAPTREAVIEHLRGEGHLPIRADELQQNSITAWLRREVGRGRRIANRDVAIIIRELATLLRAGLALDQALDTLLNFAEKEPVRELLKRVVDKVRGGVALAEAMAMQGGVFDRFCLGMVRAGEAGGTLDTVLSRTADFMERSEQSRQNVKSALIYPTILLITAFASVFIIVTFVVPNFKDIFEEAGYELPLATRVVIMVGSIAETYWWVPIVVGLAAVVIIKRMRRNPDTCREIDRRMLRIPLVGELLAKAEVMRMSFTMAMLLNSGVPLVASLPVVRETLSNTAMIAAFEGIERDVKEGRTFSAPLAGSGLFPDLATHLVRVGEESGRLEEMLFRLADIYERETQRTIQRLLTLLVPVMTIGMALLIAGIIVSILVPMLSIHELAF